MGDLLGSWNSSSNSKRGYPSCHAIGFKPAIFCFLLFLPSLSFNSLTTSILRDKPISFLHFTCFNSNHLEYTSLTFLFILKQTDFLYHIKATHSSGKNIKLLLPLTATWCRLQYKFSIFDLKIFNYSNKTCSF